MPDYTWDDLLNWTPSYAAPGSPQVDAQVTQKKEDDWGAILNAPLPPPEPKKSRMKEAWDLAKQAQSGEAPQAYRVSLPSSGQITDLVRQRVSGLGDIANVDLGKAWGGVKQQAPKIIPGMTQAMGAAVKPLINPAEFFMGNPLDAEAAKRYKEAGIEQPQAGAHGVAQPIKAMADLVMYLPELGKEFIEHPKETIENRGLEILMVLAGKGVNSAKAGLNKLRKSPLTTADLKSAFSESLANPKQFKFSPPEIETIDYLNRALEEPGTVYGPGGEIMGQSIPATKRNAPRPTGPTPMPETAEFARPEPIEPQTRQPAPGEVRGLGVEFVNKEGQPMNRAEALAVKPTAKVPTEQIAPPEAASQPPLVREFFDAIKSAKRLTPKQKNLISVEKKKRLAIALQDAKKLGGREGYEAQMKALSGAYEKVDFEPLKLTQEHIDSLFQHIEDSPAVVGFDKIQAKEGLAKMLGEKGAGIPQPKQLALLKEVFGPEITGAIIDKKPWWTRIRELGVDALNIPRAVQTSFDLSFGLRQGVFYMPRHPVKFWKEFPKQAKWFADSKASKAALDAIRNDGVYPLARESGLDIIGAEEPFQSGLAEKIPIIGKGVQASSRAYTTYASTLRMGAFKDGIKLAKKMGVDLYENPKAAQDIATVVNTVTGRGDLGRLERISKELNGAFFSPKLMASRLNVLNPAWYVKLRPVARRMALEHLASFAGYAATVVGLAKVSGLEVGVNPTSADFGKIKVGNTRIDLFGGFSQYVRLASQLISGKITSTTSGKVIKIGEGYKPTTRLDVLLRFAEAKEAPVFSFATGLFKGQNWIGEKFNIGKETANRFIPMVIQDFVDIYKDDPSLFPLGFLGVFGAGLQTYQPRAARKMYGL